MQRTEPLPQRPWVIVGPDGVFWLGLADSEAQAWYWALIGPLPEEIAEHKARGYYAAEATLTWKRPEAAQQLGMPGKES